MNGRDSGIGRERQSEEEGGGQIERERAREFSRKAIAWTHTTWETADHQGLSLSVHNTPTWGRTGRQGPMHVRCCNCFHGFLRGQEAGGRPLI